MSSEISTPTRPLNVILFCGKPLVRLLERENGWQVQRRTSRDMRDWADVEFAWFDNRKEAETEANTL